MSAAGGLLGNFVTVEIPAEGMKRHRILHFNPAHLVSVEYRPAQDAGLGTQPELDLTFTAGPMVSLQGAEAEAVYAQMNPSPDNTTHQGSYLGGGRR